VVERASGIRRDRGSKPRYPRSEAPQQPEYPRNEHRSIKPEVLVLVGVCTHQGCKPQAKGAEAKGETGADWGGRKPRP
jgi:ubiquinol-cytochrome c reductase iron-sulfur subunit